MIYRYRDVISRFAGLRKILLSQNPLIYLLIRRASRATFPDMGRLTDSLLPTIAVKITEKFYFYLFFNL